MKKNTTTFGVPRNVFWLGLVSFFNDCASEMVYPLVPIFLTTVLGAPATVLGLVEGIAESTSSILKVVFGWLSDKAHKRTIFIAAGYSFSTASKIIIGAAHGWPMVLLGRFVDRFGKGVRTAPRDALIAESSVPSIRGRSFGFHRALDTAGAVVGPLAALFLLSALHMGIRTILFIAFIPGVIGVAVLILCVREAKHGEPEAAADTIRPGTLNPPFKIFLFISAIFAVGNSSDAFLILRARSLGLSVGLTVLVYALFNLTYALCATPAGTVSDRIGPRRVLLAGFFLFGIVYLLFGLIDRVMFVWLLFPIYGLYMALTEGVGKAYISNLVPREALGTAFGMYQTAVGLCAFFASLIAGLLWTRCTVRAPFIFGGIMAVIAALTFMGLEKKRATERQG